MVMGGPEGPWGAWLDRDLVKGSILLSLITKLKELSPLTKIGGNPAWSDKTPLGKSMTLKLKMKSPIVSIRMELQFGIITPLLQVI